ncbi:geranylgeranyl pyrophosphate synthase [Candidatus Methanoperedens nitroreducens]|uniref:Geranylgeranyl pyrophosphate synthase n=1 Tax=Candidatus Methanoperedens nitratireducens TaxID=1392998 RepID=A0A062V6Z2_9EURY|nr:polyprenyl synthetase family protein [Candidatus Methanoperedens nitroreducens]KCZ72343.1 geranylgeranyl pyrophosphate synthase [Candidatus Methanoperedens nitroreducens]MDJ1423723.1 polyprenyl synthetase family protein [Candidatus Methanoperedens sp.]
MRTFKEYLDQIRPGINDRIKLIAEKKISDPDILPMLLRGKRIRAGLLLLVFDAVSDKDQDRSCALDLACAVELAHSASLILDDMLDEDTERRGLTTLHLTRGHKKAMLDTIDVLSIPYDIVAQYGESYVRMLAETQRGMVSGIIKELFHRPDLPAIKLYDAIITRKTGKLFSLATAWGYLIRSDGCNPVSDGTCMYRKDTISFAEYGLRCGKVMQIADDIADLEQVIEGKKISGFGSELLLLECMNIDRPVKEALLHRKSLSPHLSRIKQLWSHEDVQRTISSILDKEIIRSRGIISSIDVLYIEYKKVLLDAPSGIADMIIREG